MERQTTFGSSMVAFIGYVNLDLKFELTGWAGCRNFHACMFCSPAHKGCFFLVHTWLLGIQSSGQMSRLQLFFLDFWLPSLRLWPAEKPFSCSWRPGWAFWRRQCCQGVIMQLWCTSFRPRRQATHYWSSQPRTCSYLSLEPSTMGSF
jgi:hypothetical protein